MGQLTRLWYIYLMFRISPLILLFVNTSLHQVLILYVKTYFKINTNSASENSKKYIWFIVQHFQMRENTTAVLDTTLAWRTDSFYSMGILGFGVYILLGITSLPSVSNALSWREFSFVQVSDSEDFVILFLSWI